VAANSLLALSAAIDVIFTPSTTGYRAGTVAVFTDATPDPLLARVAGTGVLLPDLVLSSLSMSGTAATGLTMVVNDSVTNQGKSTASPSSVRYYLSSSPNKSSGVLLAGSRAVPALPTGFSSSGAANAGIPASMLPGPYYLVVCADDLNAVTEGAETNNCASRAISVAGTDLTEAIVPFAYPVGSGTKIQVTDSAISSGPGSAVETSTKYYISSSVSRQGAAYLGARSVPMLIGAQTSTATTSLTLPSWLTPATYFLLACTDETGAVAETNETNNCAFTSLQLAGTDLTDAITSIAGTVATGQTVQVTDQVTSTGPGSAPPSTTKYYLSATGTKSSATYLGARSVPALLGAATSMASARVQLPLWAAPGAYLLLACADETNVAAEANENNNCGSLAVQLAGTDLSETIVSMAGVLATGRSMQLTDAVNSAGPGGAPASTSKFYLSANGLKSGANYLGSRYVPSNIGAGNSTALSTLLIPSWLPPGAYTLLACADETNAVIESNENNNCAAASVQIAGTDLTETINSAPPLVTAGQLFRVTDTLASSGPGSSPATTTKYYLSVTGSKAGAFYLGARSAAPLTGAASAAATVSLSVPGALAASTYTLLACADDSNAVLETNESNNCAATPLTVTKP
jgi:subtilase family serine protease